jgi:hypothetical protein
METLMRSKFLSALRQPLWLWLLVGLSAYANAQSSRHNVRMWDDGPLKPKDFQMQIEVPHSQPCFAQFTLHHSVAGFDFLRKNFNQKVENILLPASSWMAKDLDEEALRRMLLFQQVLFDLSEVHTRNFRKALLVNKGKMASGLDVVAEIENRVMASLSEERAQFQIESADGTKMEVMERWQSSLQLRLQALSDFGYGNVAKIKI